MENRGNFSAKNYFSHVENLWQVAMPFPARETFPRGHAPVQLNLTLEIPPEALKKLQSGGNILIQVNFEQRG